jgi:hypothetical protein
MKIIDFERKGNVVRFYLGADNRTDYWGDDWDDRPYEHNAGTVYNEFVDGYIDVAFPFGCNVLDPESDYRYHGNSPYCKEDFKKRNAPCIIVLPEEIVKEDYCSNDSYSQYMGSKRVERFYFEESLERITQCPLVTVLQVWRQEDQA